MDDQKDEGEREDKLEEGEEDDKVEGDRKNVVK